MNLMRIYVYVLVLNRIMIIVIHFINLQNIGLHTTNQMISLKHLIMLMIFYLKTEENTKK